jgi:transcriptional regulator with XRE-family HTH domain
MGTPMAKAAAKSKTPKARKSSGRMSSKGFPNPIDVHVGRQIRLRRTLLGMSQSTLADAIGLTFQQVQKYEKGSNRVGSSRLFDLGRVLEVPVAYFYENMSATTSSQSPANLMGVRQADLPEVDLEQDPMARRETLELVRAYYKIPHEDARKQLAMLIKVLARASGDRGA